MIAKQETMKLPPNKPQIVARGLVVHLLDILPLSSGKTSITVY